MNAVSNFLTPCRAVVVLILASFTGHATGNEVDQRASMNGRYSELLHTINCPEDAGQYGELREYGFWAGESWCGASGITGYLVWVNPDWYVWRKRIKLTGQNADPYVPGYKGDKKESERRDCRPVHTGIVTVRPC